MSERLDEKKQIEKLCDQERILQNENQQLKDRIVSYVKTKRKQFDELTSENEEYQQTIESLTQTVEQIPILTGLLEAKTKEVELLREYKRRNEEKEAVLKA